MKLPLFLLASLLTTCAFAQSPLRLHGSTTVKSALEPLQRDLEARIGGRLELRAFGSGSGLLALAAGTADIAMISTPLDEAVRSVNDKKPGALDAAGFHAEHVGTVRLTFIVNPRNPVRRLDAAQLAAIFAGRITSWHEVGGAHQPVIVVTLSHSGSLVAERLLGGGKITERARAVQSATQIPAVVALEPGAIGIVSTAHPRGKTSVIATDAEIVTPLYLVTKGKPGSTARQLIDAARELLGDRRS